MEACGLEPAYIPEACQYEVEQLLVGVSYISILLNFLELVTLSDLTNGEHGLYAQLSSSMGGPVSVCGRS